MNDRPVHLIVSDDLERSRVSVFFRLILAIPHLIWLSLWGIVAALAVIANWFATLFAGQSPDALHNFLAAYVRYAIHVGAYLFLAAQPFPEFTGASGYPVDVEIASEIRGRKMYDAGARGSECRPHFLVYSLATLVARGVPC